VEACVEGSIRVPIAAGQYETDRALAAAVLLVIGTAATIGGFLFFQYVLGYQPCPLCLEQRIPYYVALPLAVILAIAARAGAPRTLLAVGFILIAAAMLISGGLGVYHSGVEWKWWAGPTDCSGPLTNFGSAGNLLQTIETTRVVRCDEAAWRLFGLSLAGYNVLVSLALVVVALCGVAASRRG
jgi:disulfide bond formation protein DsbB